MSYKGTRLTARESIGLLLRQAPSTIDRLNDSFQNIENEILDRLDKLFSYRKGDEISRYA